MADPVFGLSITRVDNEPRPAVTSDLSVVGLVGTAPNADLTAYPLNTPVLIFSDDPTALSKLGATGTLPAAVIGVNDQLGEFQVAARIVVVRVAAGGDEDGTITNIVGSSLAKSGLWALPEAGPLLGVIPRLIGVPGYTSQHETEDATVNVNSAAKAGGNTGNGTLALSNPAAGLLVKDGVYQIRAKGGAHAATSAPKPGGNTGNGELSALTAAGGSVKDGVYRVRILLAAANGGTFVVEDPDGNDIGGGVVGTPFTSTHIGFSIADGSIDFVVGDGFDITVVPAVPANGGVFSVIDPDGLVLADATVGVSYDGAIRFTIADGSTDFAIGDGFNVTSTITAGNSLANPVVASLAPVLERLLAHAVVSGPSTSYAAWLNWRETIQSSRIIPLASAVKVGAAAIQQDAAPRVIGIGVRRDHEKEGRPFHSWANQPIQGIVGPSRAIGFSLTDGSTEGQTILSHNGGVILRGEAGVETAIASGGFVYIGTDNAGEDDLWRFYNVTRGRDYIHLMFLKTLRSYLGRFNLTVQTIEAVQNTMKLALRNLQADGDILGFKVGFVPNQNSPEELRLGKFTVDFQAEEAPVLRHIALRSMRYRPALDALLGELMAQIDASA